MAHRGASGHVAEHTLGAYRLAIDEGADALECDVRLTRDGVLVCVHDRRVDRTSDGRGSVSTYTLRRLADLDFAAWHAGDEAPAPVDTDDDDGPEHRRVLTLERLMRVVLDASRPVGLHVETKHPTRAAGRVERALVELLGRHGLLRAVPPDEPAPVHLMSFSPVALSRLALAAPDVPRVLLLDDLARWAPPSLLAPWLIDVGPSVDAVRADPDLVARAHRRGLGVHVWTVDEPADVDRVVAAGADSVITNYPGRVLARLGGPPPRRSA